MSQLPKRRVRAYAEFVCKHRMPYMRCDYTVHDKAYRDSVVVLMGNVHKHPDMGKLRLGTRRATHGRYVLRAVPAEELPMHGLSKPRPADAEAMEVDDPADMKTGGSHCVEYEMGWALSLY